MGIIPNLNLQALEIYHVQLLPGSWRDYVICGGPGSVNNVLHEFRLQRSMAASNNDQTGVMRAHRLVEYLEEDFHAGDV